MERQMQPPKDLLLKESTSSIGGTPKLQKKRGASHSRIIEKEMVLPETAYRKAEKTLLGS